MRARTLPDRKTSGSGYNLHPSTERVPASALRPGHVVLEAADYPAVVTRAHRSGGQVVVYARYVWQAAHEPSWLMGRYAATHPFDRARPGEY